jgi:hypothetical protein
MKGIDLCQFKHFSRPDPQSSLSPCSFEYRRSTAKLLLTLAAHRATGSGFKIRRPAINRFIEGEIKVGKSPVGFQEILPLSVRDKSYG